MMPKRSVEPVELALALAAAPTEVLMRRRFDATLNGDADALARLAPERLAAIEDLTWQAK